MHSYANSLGLQFDFPNYSCKLQRNLFISIVWENFDTSPVHCWLLYGAAVANFRALFPIGLAPFTKVAKIDPQQVQNTTAINQIPPFKSEAKQSKTFKGF